MIDPNDIATSRPPDRVDFTDWEPIYGPKQRKQIATATVGFFFQTVTEWTEIEHEPITGYKRKRMEFWEEPARRRPHIEGDTITLVHVPKRTVGRWEWEYR